MASKTFILPFPSTAMHIGRSGLHSVIITTTDGLKPTSSAQTSTVAYFDRYYGGSVTNNIDWANSYIKVYDAAIYDDQKYKQEHLRTFPLRYIQFDPRYLTQDADGESWTITNQLDLTLYVGGSTSNSSFQLQASGNLRYNKPQNEGWLDWGGNGSGSAVDLSEWNTFKFRTQSNLDASLVASGDARTISLYANTIAANIGTTVTNQLMYAGPGSNYTLSAGSSWYSKWVTDVTISNKTFDKFGLFLQTNSPSQTGTVIVEFHSVTADVIRSDPNRTPELSMSLSLGSEKFIGKRQSYVAHASFFELQSPVTLNGNYAMVVRSTGMSPDQMSIATSPTSGSTLWTWNGSSYSQSFSNLAFPFVLASGVASNTAPTDIILSNSTIAENSAGLSVVGSLSVTDAESSPQVYSLVAGAGDTHNSLFEISGSSLRIKSDTVLNFETQSSYSVRVKATDTTDSAFTFEKSFTISVTNVNEDPTSISLSASSIQENNAINALIGLLSAVDPENQPMTFSIQTGFDKFNISGSQLRASVTFDYEVAVSHSITVRATDSSGGYIEQMFVISVLNQASDDPVTIQSPVVLGGKAVAAVSVDPRTTPVRVTISGVEQALPTGSVVKLSSTGQKFLKVSGDELAFTAISVTPDAEWSWTADGMEAWAILQSL